MNSENSFGVMSTTNFFETPPFLELSQLEQKRADILSRLDEDGLLTPELKDAYSRGLDVVGNHIVQIVSQAGFQDEIINYGQAAVRNLEGLETLEGILPEEELGPLRTDFTQRLAAVRNFLEHHSDYLSESTRAYLEQSLGEVAVVGGLGPIIPEATALPAEEEVPPAVPIETTGEKDRVQLELTARKGVLQIGKHGKIVPFSKNLQPGHRDYGQERLAVLRVLVENQERLLKSGELKEASGNPNMTNNEFAVVRSWLLSLTYRRQPLIEKTGSTKGSSYGIAPQFNIDLVDAEASEAEKEDKTLLDKGDVWVAVRQLETYRPMLANLGIPTIEGNLLDALKKYMPDYSILKNDTRAIRSVRQAALGRILEFLEDEERFLTYLERAKENDPDYKFVSYLFELEAEQREVLKAIMQAVEVIREERPDGYIMVAVDAQDQPVAQTKLITDRPPTPFVELITKPSSVASDAAEPSATIESSDLTTGFDYGDIEQPKRARLSKANRQRLDTIRVTAERLADRYLGHYDPDRVYRRDHLEAHFRKLTTRTIANAVENNIGPSAGRGNIQRDLGIHDIVNILIYSDPKLRNIYCNQGLKKQVRYVILQAVQQRIEKQKEKKK